MLWPRLAALAEVLWSPAGERNFQAFRTRLEEHRKRLEALDVGCHP
jgi:hexosaminidase